MVTVKEVYKQIDMHVRAITGDDRTREVVMFTDDEMYLVQLGCTDFIMEVSDGKSNEDALDHALRYMTLMNNCMFANKKD